MSTLRLACFATISAILSGCGTPPPPEIGQTSQAVCISGPAFPTCSAHCGFLACSPVYPSLCCACDAACVTRGDCCCDHETYCPGYSCAGHCGGQASSGCWCDSLCSGYGDCCGDFTSTCERVTALSANGHTCALTFSGHVRCWGNNEIGELGYGNTNNIGDNETPASAGNVNVGGTVTQIVTGSYQTCALLSTGAVRCWGENYQGELGYGNGEDIGDNELPASAGNLNIGGTATQIAAGAYHNCALLSTGNVRCWGWGGYGLLGYGNTNSIGDNETPASAGDVNVGGTVTQIALGQFHACALLSTGNLRCWGGGAHGAIGYGNTNDIGDNEAPASAGDVNVGGTVTQVAAGLDFTCALLSTGNLRCWGWNHHGELGYGHTNIIGDNETPASAGNVNVGGTVTQITAGGDHACALLSTGAVRCWGGNDYGQLGYGNTNAIGDNETPASAGDVNVGGTVVRVAAGKGTTCVLLSTGAVRCWGYGHDGALGYGNQNNIGDNETPASAGDVHVL